MMARAVACGKVILLGEHFVVPHTGSEAAPAIALPLRGLSCEVSISRNGTASCHAEEAPEAQRPAVEERMAKALTAAAAALSVDARDVEVRSRATFPLSRGFGSSAAFSVALTRALDALSESGTRDLGAATHAVETVFHGTPSGLDTAVILAERTVRFQNGRIVRFVPSGSVDFVAVDSGPRDDAAPLIRAVKERRAAQPAAWSRLAAHVTSLVDACERALGAGDALGLGRRVDEAHGILSDLGLSSPSVEKVLSDGRDAGALGGKVSGAGAGGAVVLVAKSGDGARLARVMKSAGHQIVAVSPS